MRPTRASDANSALSILSNFNVCQMLRLVSYPIDEATNTSWFDCHESEWNAGSAFRFAIELDQQFIGVIDVDEIENDGTGELGYWLDQPFWGQRIASEAARAVVEFAFVEVGLHQLNSGHASDNVASGKVLRGLGFSKTGETNLMSKSRGCLINQIKYSLKRECWARSRESLSL